MLAACCATPAAATIVRFDTVLGDIPVRLYDTATPLSVANFLNYVDDGDYDDSFIHRAPPNFVIQGGGFRWVEGGEVSAVPTDAPVLNEPGISNLRGTLAYAKLGGDPNSATSGWFFNVADNSSNLDAQNGGFTVFGRVIGDGLDVVDAIAGQTIVNAGDPFSQLPVLDTFSPPTILRDDLVFVNTIEELDVAAGDYNFDGVVDAADYVVWRNSRGSTTLAEADGNGDGVVDDDDLTVWRLSYGETSGGAAVAVPEPGAAVLAGLATLGAWRRR